MGRWEPNARERLVRVALDLFGEKGYDAATVSEIAERAGLTKTTFFRHFADKREVLFAGQEIHNRIVGEALAAAPAAATPLTAVGLALDALAGSFPAERRELAARVRVVIGSHGELRERAVFKRAALAGALAAGLAARGVGELEAGLAGELGVRAFYAGFDEWVSEGNREELGEPVRRALAELRIVAAALS